MTPDVPHLTPEDGPVLSDDQLLAGVMALGGVRLRPGFTGYVRWNGTDYAAFPFTFGDDRTPCLRLTPVDA